MDEETTVRRENPAFAEIRRRAAERLGALKIGAQAVSLALAAPPGAFASSTDSDKSQQPERLALATAKNSSFVVSDASDAEGDHHSHKMKTRRSSRSRRQ
jgi:hypothetical protein